MIKEFDNDGNGEIDFAEFANMMSTKFKELNNESVIEEVFNIFDSGILSSSPLRFHSSNLPFLQIKRGTLRQRIY